MRGGNRAVRAGAAEEGVGVEVRHPRRMTKHREKTEAAQEGDVVEGRRRRRMMRPGENRPAAEEGEGVEARHQQGMLRPGENKLMHGPETSSAMVSTGDTGMWTTSCWITFWAC